LSTRLGKGRRKVPRFDRTRFQALVLFIAWRTKDDPDFGRVKLAKTLCYSDFSVYLKTGRALTGATYIRKPQGPVPSELPDAERALRRLKLVTLDHEKDEYEPKRIIAERPPVDEKLKKLFEPWQLEMVEKWIEQIKPQTAAEVSDTSHELAGWKMAGTDGTPIPYSAALLPWEKPSELDAKVAERRARKKGWLTDDGWIWEREAAGEE
jgi:Antitoxin SocA-like, Panacea domain